MFGLFRHLGWISGFLVMMLELGFGVGFLKSSWINYWCWSLILGVDAVGSRLPGGYTVE